MGQGTPTTFDADPNQILDVPIRSAMFDGPVSDQLGNLTRTWVLFFQTAFAGSGGGGTPGPRGPAGLPGPAGPPGSGLGSINLNLKRASVVRTVDGTVIAALAESTSVARFGVTGQPDPITGFPIDESAQFQEACNTMAVNGGWLRIPAGFRIYLGTSIAIPSGLRIIGDGAQLCGIVLVADMAPGLGLLDLAPNTTDVDLIGFRIDGQTGDNVTGSLHGTTGIAYTSYGAVSDAQWTDNTSIWIHEGCSRIRIEELDVLHTGGYAIYGRAQSSLNGSGVTVTGCTFTDNRPFLGGPTGNIVFGTIGGGVLFHNDGTSAFWQDVTVEDCKWFRSTGNCLWTHADSILDRRFLNRNIRFLRNYFEDSGLDCTQAAGIDGYLETDNLAVRVGYVCLDDAGSTRTPRWNVIPVAFDTAGILLNAVRDHNEVRCGNCELYDADGAGLTTMSNSIFESAFDSFDELADAAHCGVWNALGVNQTRGIVSSNSNGVADVGTYMIMSGNEFYGAAGGAILAFGLQHSKIIGNLFFYPDAYTQAPIILGNLNIGGSEFRSFDNDVSSNTFHISASGSSGPCIAESVGPGGLIPNTNFRSSDINRVRDNTFNTQFFEFLKDPNSSSTTGITAIASTTAQPNGIVETHILTQGINTATFQTQLWSNSVASVGVAPTGSQMATFTPAAAFFPALGIGSTGVIDPAFNITGHSFTITGATIPLVISSAGDVTARSLAAGTATPYDLITNSSVNIVDSQATPVGTTHGSGMTLRGSALGYMTAIENFDNATNANGLLVKVLNTNPLTRAFTVNIGGSDLFAVTGNGVATAAAYSIAGSGIVDNARNFTGHSFSIDGVGVIIDNTGAFVGSIHPIALAVGSPSYTAGVPLFSQSHGNFANTGTDQSAVVGLLGPAATDIKSVLEYFHPYSIDHLISDSAGAFGAIIPSTAVGWEGNALSGMVVALNPANVPSNVIGSCAGRFYALGGVNGATVWALNTLVRDFAFDDYTGHSYAATLIGNEMDCNISNMGTQATGLNINIAWLTPGFAHPTFHQNTALNIGGGTNPAYWDTGIDFNNGNANVAIRVGLLPPVLGINSQFINWTSGSGGIYETTMYADSIGQFTLIANHFGVGGSTPHAVVFDNSGTVQANAFGINGSGVIHSDRNFYGHSYKLQPDPYANSVAYVVGAMVVDSNGHRQFCISPGTSQSSGHPLWNTTGGTTVDNFVTGPLTWRDMGATPEIVTVDAFNTGTFAGLKIGPDVVTNPFAAAITVNGVVAMDLSRDCNFNAVSIAGTPVLSSSSSTVGASTFALIGSSLNVGGGSVTCGSLSVSTFSPSIINATQYQAAGTNIINSAGQWIGGAIVISAGIQCGGITSTTAGINLGSQGISCGGMTLSGTLAAGSQIIQCGRVDPSGGHTGQSITATFASGFTVSGSLFHSLIFVGGILVSFV